MQKDRTKVILAVLDGWGVAPPNDNNALTRAKTPTIDYIEQNYFSLSLQASGMAVGLPWGEAGSSEVGHLNIGAGRIVYQYLPRITEAIRDESFFQNKAFIEATNHVKRYNSTLHVMGLVSCGMVHSSADHLYALIELAQKNKIQNFVVHAFTDGKNCGAHEGAQLIKNLEKKLENFACKNVGSVIGRMYAMDRNNHWQLTEKAYKLLVNDAGQRVEDAAQYMEDSYSAGLTDFNIEPAAVGNAPRVCENDALIFFNFREDSARQLTHAFVDGQDEFDKFKREKINNLFFVTMTEYAQDLPVSAAFKMPAIENHLTQVLSENEVKQLHLAESEKYAHVTYFFNGGNERAYEGEERELLMPHNDKNPAMRAYDITQKIIDNIDRYDFFLINYANADIAGHNGNMKLAIQAAEIIDANAALLVELTKKLDVILVITADHGNAEKMYDTKTGERRLLHTKNPVPFYIVGKGFEFTGRNALHEQEPKGVLADIAPTILEIMEIKKPKEMTGKSLLQLI